MVIFLFIAISYMLHIRADKEKIEQIAVTYEKLQSDLYSDLEKEFRKDLDEWNAVLNKQTSRSDSKNLKYYLRKVRQRFVHSSGRYWISFSHATSRF